MNATVPLPVTLRTTSSGDAAALEAGGLSLLQYPASELASGPAGVHLRVLAAEGSDGPGAAVSRPLTGPTSAGRRLADGTILTVHGDGRKADGDLTADAGHAADGPLEALTLLRPAADGRAWAWTVRLRHRGTAPIRLDLLHTLDAALTEQDAIRRNEQYVAQYLDLAPVPLPAAAGREASLVLAVRQNMPGPRAPWAAIGASTAIASWATDALQLLDRRTGEGLETARELPSERLQHEHTLVALRTAEITLSPGEEWSGSFWGVLLADHPAATGPADAPLIRELQERIEASLPPHGGTSGEGTTLSSAAEYVVPVPASLLAAAPALAVREVGAEEIAEFAGGPLRLVEQERRTGGARPGEDGTERPGPRLLSAFTDRGHLVTAAKERTVLRPHGHVQQVHARAAADLDVVASTVWMRGVFCSQLTLGHASTGALTTVRRSYLGLDRTGGVRLLFRTADAGWSLLSAPSLWRTTGAESEWLYLTDDLTLRVRSSVELGTGAVVEIEVSGAERGAVPGPAQPGTAQPGPALPIAAELLLVVGAESSELEVRATADGDAVEVGDDAPLFADGAGRGTAVRTARLQVRREARVRLGRRGADGMEEGSDTGASSDAGTSTSAAVAEAVVPSAAPYAPRLPALRGGDADVAAVGEMLGWLAQNASIHFRSPRGLEQYTGGAWGTRDVCQGPVGLLLATDEPAVLRATLLAVLAGQQEDGTWPQWFDYLPGYAGPGLRDSHGDVVYWPLLALGEYLAVTGDHGILAVTVPWVGQDAMREPTSVLDHLSRALDHLEGRRTEDPRLPAYGHGDWNDSLQPARPELAEHMCSTWTTELEIKALTALADGIEGGPAGAASEGAGSDTSAVGGLVARCRAIAAGAEAGLREHLLVDGELAGYAILESGRVEHLVHPADVTTGVRHGSLQMIDALAGELLEPEEARHHLDLLREHLAGPTGLYLFDRPIGYHGGEMRVFQRAETATFWGREVGLMYMHSHLRFIEALTHLGEADLAWQELLKAVPVGLGERVRGARPRQANCYYSSSDAVFPDRYVAAENPSALFEESTGFEGGWRVYSSGPGLLLRILVEDVLGVRRRADRLEIDPVLPAALDGLEADVPYDGGLLTVRFRRGATGCGVRELRADGRALEPAAPGPARRYRDTGVSLDRRLVPAGTVLEVVTG